MGAQLQMLHACTADTGNICCILLALRDLSIYLICPESKKKTTECGQHIQRTGQWDHSSTEHCQQNG